MDDGAKVAQAYDRLGGGYTTVSRLVDRTPLGRMRAALIAQASGDVLEIAVGTGVNLRLYPAGVRLVGLDFAAKALDAASRKAAEAGVDWTPLVGDAERVALPDACVDTVVCTLGGCTFAHPEVVFGEVRRVLRPDGQALFLEHVRPRGRVGRAAVATIKPLTRAVLGCNPDRDTVATITAAGLTPRVLDQAAGGVLLSLRATPA